MPSLHNLALVVAWTCTQPFQWKQMAKLFSNLLSRPPLGILTWLWLGHLHSHSHGSKRLHYIIQLWLWACGLVMCTVIPMEANLFFCGIRVVFLLFCSHFEIFRLAEVLRQPFLIVAETSPCNRTAIEIVFLSWNSFRIIYIFFFLKFEI